MVERMERKTRLGIFLKSKGITTSQPGTAWLILFYCPMWWATHKGGTVKTCYVRTRMSMPPPNNTLTLAATRIGCEESAHCASPVSFCCLQSASTRARPALPLPHYTIRQPEVELVLPSLFRGGNSSRANSDVPVVYASGRFQLRLKEAAPITDRCVLSGLRAFAALERGCAG
ncbi:hypothetical protein BJV78DRAFT_1158114 [Lactifluus subvellereus]|nr:hypothetical protein BJV78DRAFT_1158114 [Lactifluus subvellereus]